MHIGCSWIFQLVMLDFLILVLVGVEVGMQYFEWNFETRNQSKIGNLSPNNKISKCSNPKNKPTVPGSK